MGLQVYASCPVLCCAGDRTQNPEFVWSTRKDSQGHTSELHSQPNMGHLRNSQDGHQSAFTAVMKEGLSGKRVLGSASWLNE